MLSSSPSKITDLAIPGASLRPADLAAPAKLRNARGLRSGARGLPGPHPTLGRPQRPTRPVPTVGHRQLGAVEMYIGPFDPARLASAKAAVPDDGRAPGGASSGLPHPAGAGAYEASMSAVSSGQPNVPPETLRDCRVPRYLLLRLRPVQSSSAVPAGLPTGPRPRRSSRLPLLRQMPRPAGAGDPQG
jgi:hypothetical protein